MDKSVWTSYFIEATPEEAVSLLAGRGWRTAELSCEHSEALLHRGEPETTGREFAAFCRDLGMGVPQGHLKLRANIANPDPAARSAEIDELRRWLDLYAALGIASAVLHPGGWRMLEPGPIPPDAFALNVESLGRLLAHSSGTGVCLCLENGGNAGELRRLIEAAGPDGLAICLDTGHLSVVRGKSDGAGESERTFVREAGSLLRALHLADNDGSGDQHRMPFEGGAVDWQGLAQALAELGFGGPLNYEIPGENRCPMEERLEKLDRLAEITEDIFGRL
jgi:sugar phosphate isomerase/epimerase